MIESQQIVLQLTEDKQVLAQLRKNKKLVNKNGLDTYVGQFDGQIFEFKKGIPVTLNANVAKALRRNSGVIVGEHIDGEILAALDEKAKFQIGEENPIRRKLMTSCPVCEKDMRSLQALSKHLAVAHKEDRAELYVSTNAGTQEADYDTPLDEQLEKE